MNFNLEKFLQLVKALGARGRASNLDFGVQVKSHYQAWLYRGGRLLWHDEFENLVVTLGRNALLNNTFDAAAGSVAWYVGLKAAGSVAAGDTMASHAGWSEITTYSNGTRPAWTKNGSASAGAMSNSSSKASFSINGSTTVSGAFLTSDSTKGGTSGTLYGGGDFSGGSRAVQNGDTLNVQVDLSITSS